MSLRDLFLLLLTLTGSGPAVARQHAVDLFSDDFESGLAGWEVGDALAIHTIDSGDAAYGRVLLLSPAHDRLAALIRGSEDWPAYRIEADVLFPTDEQNYLGLIYNYRDDGRRIDFGSLYIKGNNSYVRVNPRRDWNPGRQLYEEYRIALRGADSIEIGEWQHFAAEIAGGVCHFYVGDMTTPKVTFDLYEGVSGKAGFKPRVVGGAVWLDNVRVRAIDRLSYSGPRQPTGIEYAPERLVTDWEVLGPLTRAWPALEREPEPAPFAIVDGGMRFSWNRFETDPRGAVVTGRLTEFLGDRTVAYFRTAINVPEGGGTRLEFSSIDDLAIWINGRFKGYGARGDIAWHDFGRNPDHPATSRVPLAPGINHVLIRVRGGQYATGGFFARVVRIEGSGLQQVTSIGPVSLVAFAPCVPAE